LEDLMPPKIARFPIILALILALGLSVHADSRTQLKPGWNLFSPEQDVEMGKEVSKEAESQLPIIRNGDVAAYIDALGKQLAARAPGEKYPYQFKVVNDKGINAFALPGGFIYVNRGVIEAADNEAQVAGVLAHEIGHVVLRHGTNQASKAYVAQAPLSILGGVLGSNSVGAVLAQLGVGFAANSILLKYSRDAERQADLMGTQILYDSGYEPHAMVEFFEKIQAESKGRSAEFFSSHPNPDNRITNVQHEIVKLGGAPARARGDSPDFQTVKRQMLAMAAPPKSGTGSAANTGTTDSRTGRPDAPSSRLVTYNGQDMEFKYPENWRQYGQANAIALAPEGGVVNENLAYGMMIQTFEPHNDRDGTISLEEATDQLIDELRRTNPKMRITRSHERIRVNGQRALSSQLTNDSPIGGRETDWLVTMLDRDGILYYMIGVAPAADFSRYDGAFDDVISSFRLK
jgi:beta-barrel assembly-enhancing protease